LEVFLKVFLKLANQTQALAMDANQRTLLAADKVPEGRCKAVSLVNSLAPNFLDRTLFCGVLSEQTFDAEFLFHRVSPFEVLLSRCRYFNKLGLGRNPSWKFS
jgi:hypothetical protein